MSTLKSSAEDLTLNADGSGNDVIIQSDGSTLVTVDGSNSRLEVKGATRITRSATSDTYLDVTMSDINVTLNAYDPDGYADWSLQSNGTEWLGYDGLAQKEVVINEDSADVDFRVESDGNANALFVDGANGDVTIGAGDLIFGTAGKGICLGVTSNTDANTLDDYEEGTWTPVVTSTGGTYSNQAGMYTKIGRLVNIFAFVSGTSFTYSAATDLFNITGAPFSAVSAGYTGQAGSFYGKLNWNNSGSASTTDSIVTPTIAGTTLALNVNNSADADAGNARIKVDNNGAFYVQISLTYWV